MLTMDGKVLKWCCSFASMVMLRMISMLVEILIMVMLLYLHGATWASRPCTCSRPPVVCSHGNHYHGKIFLKLLDLEFCCQFVFWLKEREFQTWSFAKDITLKASKWPQNSPFRGGEKHGNKMKDFKKLTRWVPFLQLIYLLYLVFTLLCCTSLKILSSLDDDDDENDNDDRDDDDDDDDHGPAWHRLD